MARADNHCETAKRSHSEPISTDYWYDFMIGYARGESCEEGNGAGIHGALVEEKPSVLSCVMERTCNLRCRHCLYQTETSSVSISKQNNLSAIVENIAKQLPSEQDGPRFCHPALIHEGRIVRPWHIDMFARIRERIPNCRIGMIDNGTYTSHVKHFQEQDVKLDWLDVSLDGMKEAHNSQRDPEFKRAWDNAIHGLTNARKVTTPRDEGGKVSSLMTLSSINCEDISKVADFIFSANPHEQGLPLADEFHIVPMVPYRWENREIDLSIEQFADAWEQILDVWHTYNTAERQKFFVKSYNINDLNKLGAVVGYGTLWNSLTDTSSDQHVEVDVGSLTFTIDGVRVSFFPTSIWPQESFLIDADGANRIASCQQYRLDQLHTDPALKRYTVAQLSPHENFEAAYNRELAHWWEFFGRKQLEKEAGIFRDLYRKRNSQTGGVIFSRF